MLYPRIMPCLLIKNGELVKTINFKDEKYIGDPLNTVKIFNEKEVDELIILDISAYKNGNSINYKLIKNLANECNMPLCYGGGIKNEKEAEKIIKLGVEKIAISSAAVNNLEIIKNISKKLGAQSVVVVLDVKLTGILKKKYEIFLNNGTKATGLDALEFARKVEESNVGEIIINSIDRDGTMSGFDFDLIEKIGSNIKIPITVLGGAGKENHFSELFKRYKLIGAAAGSFFIFKGQFKAVLIQYPDKDTKIKFFTN